VLDNRDANYPPKLRRVLEMLKYGSARLCTKLLRKLLRKLLTREVEVNRKNFA